MKTIGLPMKTIGLLGGMSWESTAEYYRHINEEVKRRLGHLHSARIALYSVDFEDVEQLQQAGHWDQAADLMIDAARRVERAGADLLLICTNTMHKVAEPVADALRIPLLHIADATADAIKRQSIQRVGLLGTRFTMEEAFYRGRLVEKHGLEVVVPEAEQREIVHRVIYDELCVGRIEEQSRQQYLDVIDDLVRQGAQAVILGCTEIGLLIREDDCAIPVFDTTHLHAQAAVDYALADE